MATDVPNRWMKLRQPRGFSDLEFDVFRASCEIVAAYAHWRLPTKEIGFLNADPEWRKRMQA
jgi:hypothetical protein